jgi:hypothetical protein
VYKRQLKRAEAQSAAHALATIKKAANNGTWQAAAWILERRHDFRRDPLPMDINTSNNNVLVDPTTPEGREMIIAQISELPEDMILDALNRNSK